LNFNQVSFERYRFYYDVYKRLIFSQIFFMKTAAMRNVTQLRLWKLDIRSSLRIADVFRCYETNTKYRHRLSTLLGYTWTHQDIETNWVHVSCLWHMKFLGSRTDNFSRKFNFEQHQKDSASRRNFWSWKLLVCQRCIEFSSFSFVLFET